MPLEEPGWWYSPSHTTLSRLLLPLSRLYARRATARLQGRIAYRSRLPVICVGNFTAGGTGKTPLALELATRLTQRNERPAILTRGYGGKERGPIWVDPKHHTATDVGDEPMLLARTAPTLIARDRREGAIAIEQSVQGYTVIIMDDGLQNPALAKDLTIAIVDASRGVGNGEVIPAGPLRAPLELQLQLVDTIVVNRPPAETSSPATSDREVPAPPTSKVHEILRHSFPGPVLAASALPAGDVTWIRERPLVAFAGIANPARFFNLLQQSGATLAAKIAFKDHHPYTEADARRLLEEARTKNASLVTTEKDIVRIEGRTGDLGELASMAKTLAIRMQFHENDSQRLDDMLAVVLTTGGYREREAGC